jgi:hypothetical protein
MSVLLLLAADCAPFLCHSMECVHARVVCPGRLQQLQALKCSHSFQ